jgi:hypothetical protein
LARGADFQARKTDLGVVGYGSETTTYTDDV